MSAALLNGFTQICFGRPPHSTTSSNHPPSIDNNMPPLHSFLRPALGAELQRILDHSFFLLRHDLQMELLDDRPDLAASDADVITAIWTTHLNVIRSVLVNFPTLRTSFAANTPALSTTMSGSAFGAPSQAPATASRNQPPHHGPAVADCLGRDGNRCIITNRPASDWLPLDVAHIIPYALANHPQCRQFDFWKMLDLFLGAERTDVIWVMVSGSGVNGLENVFTVDKSIHSMFYKGTITFTPMTPQGSPITAATDHQGAYMLSVGYPMGMPSPELVTSGRISGTNTAGALPAGATVPIECRQNGPQYASAIPSPSLWAIRSTIAKLQRICAYEESTAANMPSLPLAPLAPCCVVPGTTDNGPCTTETLGGDIVTAAFEKIRLWDGFHSRECHERSEAITPVFVEIDMNLCERVSDS
ncbi:hypothetical protein C7212DRAFT_361372 [Tuber magnatum]|uniref:HNH nuclease domain-containing protein n=1 Tax=Tuber magnatum TaxID=42249 RepID=A0A317T2G2_9PEZI|nr:hypothetical protein C7212DRAFT_361372 [Tuber magnatum]